MPTSNVEFSCAKDDRQIELFSAAYHNDVVKLRKLLSSGVDFVFVHPYPDGGKQLLLPMTAAITNNATQCIKALLHYGSLATIVGPCGVEFLLIALQGEIARTKHSRTKFFNNTPFDKNDGFILITKLNKDYYLIYTEKDLIECIKDKRYKFPNEAKLREQLFKGYHWFVNKRNTNDCNQDNVPATDKIIKIFKNACQIFKNRNDVINAAITISQLARHNHPIYSQMTDEINAKIAASIASHTSPEDENELYNLACDNLSTGLRR